MRFSLAIISLFLFFSGASAQCTIQAKRQACVNDLVNFTLSLSSGSATSYSWDFGSYGSSSNTNPLVKFTAKGSVIVSCTANLSGGGTCIDTHTLFILPSPRAKVALTSNSQFCLAKNQICLNDSILPGLRGIKSVTLLWGDGNLGKFNQPLQAPWCHKYYDTGNYKLDMEVADSAGCKDKFSLNIHISPSVNITSKLTDSVFCDSVKLCLSNTVSGGNKITTQWLNMPSGTNAGLNLNWCKTMATGDKLSLRLIAKNEFACADTLDLDYKANNAFFKVQKIDSIVCLNEMKSGALVFKSTEELQWYLNGNAEYIDKQYVTFGARIGMNYIKATRLGGCKGAYFDSFEVRGVRAIGRIYNENRRRVQDTAFLIDYTKAPKGKTIYRLWDFGDKSAPQCTTWTERKINIGKNCNYSRDSIARHYYHDSDCYAPRLIISDPQSDCYDDTLMGVYRRDACPKLFLPDIVCLGDLVAFNIPGNMNRKVRSKAYFKTDTGRTSDSVWLVNGFGVYKYKTIGYKSPILRRYYYEDTVWTEKKGQIVVKFIRQPEGWISDTFLNKIKVVPRAKADFKLTKISPCNPYKVKLDFKDSTWYYPKQLVIEWGDTVEVIKDIKDTVLQLKSFVHTYKGAGRYTIRVTMLNTNNCNNEFKEIIAFSHIADFRTKIRCVEDAVCFQDSVRDIQTQTQWTNNNVLGKLYWEFSDGKKDSGFNICHKFPKEGTWVVTMRSVSAAGCASTNKDTFILAKPLARIKFQPTIYCSEIRQYFDSSDMSRSGTAQIINQWRWNFGDGSNPVFVKNPAHIFPGGGIYKTQLKVTTNWGCIDSVTKTFTVLGPVPKATIVSDSSGCAPLRVVFGNLSQKTKNFIWEFGDPKNTIYSTDRDTNTKFTYTQAGEYYIQMTGGDSFYNPTTGSKYYCSVKYPAPGQPALRVKVFEAAAATFEAPQLLCEGDTIWFKNTSANKNIPYFWRLGSDTQTRKHDSFFLIGKQGKMRISLLPKPSGLSSSSCLDSAEKNIEVVELIPSFELDCKQSNGAEIYLKNTSGYEVPGYEWTLLELPDSNEQFLSGATHLRYDFKNDTGLKWICLGINGGKSCGGKGCQPVIIQSTVFMANVFTPGVNDGFNDYFKVPIYGYSNFNIRIFNRWGERIFESENPKDEWNGRVFNTGPEVPDGNYFYQITYKPECADNVREIEGSITLIRKN
jgi:gliding motility-associated-like protein